MTDVSVTLSVGSVDYNPSGLDFGDFWRVEEIPEHISLRLTVRLEEKELPHEHQATDRR